MDTATINQAKKIREQMKRFSAAPMKQKSTVKVLRYPYTSTRNTDSKFLSPIEVTPPTNRGTDINIEEIIARVLSMLPPQSNEDELFTKVIEKIQKEKLIDVSHIRNWQSFVYKGTKYGMEEMMHGGGSSSSAGITVITITGVINDVNVTFTAASLPTLLNINGGFYQKTGGAITWSYLAGTITLSSPVGTGGSIYGVA